MVRISGVNLPNEKRIEIGLTYVFGIGLTTSKKIIADAKINPDTRVKELTEVELEKIRKEVAKFKTEGDLRLEVSQAIKRLKDINCYRGTRHIKGLPARGQKTKTNARTKKGKKKTMGSGKKAAGKRL